VVGVAHVRRVMVLTFGSDGLGIAKGEEFRGSSGIITSYGGCSMMMSRMALVLN